MITIRYKGNNQVVTPTIFPDGTSQVWKIENIEQYQDKEVDIIWNFEKEEELIWVNQLLELLWFSKSNIDELYIPYLPLEIKTLPEGSRVPVGVPVLTVRNTLPEYYWLTNFIESYLSTEGWKMSTSATIADYYRKILTKWSNITGGNKDFIDFQAHDFSYRGMSFHTNI